MTQPYWVPCLALIAGWAVAAATPCQALGAPVKLVGTFGEWKVYALEDGVSRLCFASAEPKAVLPPETPREGPRLFISGWLKDGVKSEPSVKMGVALKKGAEVKVSVGGTTFSLFANGERAYVDDPTQELKLLDAMKKGSVLIVQAQPERGLATKDTYSLVGLGQALQALSAGCP